ncbi:MAG: YebC/PmpR family DNA-binding transcriptional regulator [Armatimonadetes bacterium]|nr:YebC/PmpR family DNA-binding transcriptional regulator [Armatimonadota bacterium]
MSGHSKWHNIRLRKAAVDTQKAKIFAKIAREIIVAARGGGDPEANPRLRLALQKAREGSMPNDNIQRAIKRGSGDTEGVSYEEVVYEGYGPGGAAVLVDAMTDNRNRTVADLRKILSRHGGSMGEAGCVAWLFSRKGIVLVPAGTVEDEDALMEMALETGAEDMRVEEETYEIQTPVEVFEEIKNGLQQQGLAWSSAEIRMIPSSHVLLSGDDARKMLRMMEALEDHDDVQQVSSNFDIPEEFFEENQ